MKTKAQVLSCLDDHKRGRSPTLRKRPAAIAAASAVRRTARRSPGAVCWRCSLRRETAAWQADHICPVQKIIDFGHPQYLAAACSDCNRERQKEYPYPDQVARLKSGLVVLSHPHAAVFRFLADLSQVLFGSPRHASILIGWCPPHPLYTDGKNGWRVEYEAGNKRLRAAGLL